MSLTSSSGLMDMSQPSSFVFGNNPNTLFTNGLLSNNNNNGGPTSSVNGPSNSAFWNNIGNSSPSNNNGVGWDQNPHSTGGFSPFGSNFNKNVHDSIHVDTPSTFGFGGNSKRPNDGNKKSQKPSNNNLLSVTGFGNDFALSLYSAVIQSKPGNKNAILSPFSIIAALSMVNVGARGTTKQQILNATGLAEIGKSDQQLDDTFKQLFSTLEIRTTGENGEQKNGQRTEPTLNLANRVYVAKDLKVNPEFSDRLNTSYNSTFGKLDPKTGKNDINSWVESVTNGKIKDLFENIDPDVRMVLVSAIYFKAQWQDKFEGWNTMLNADFFVSSTNPVKVPMMSMLDTSAGYGEFPQLDATGLLKSYVGWTVRLVVILPNKKDGLAELEKKLTKDVFATKNYAPGGSFEVQLKLPRFRIEDSYQMIDYLKKLGIQDAFGVADFGGISNEPLNIDQVVHKAFIDVDEEGTEAAAATGATAAWNSNTIGPQRTRKDFNADHPFIFAIQHVATESILFIGRYTGPTAN